MLRLRPSPVALRALACALLLGVWSSSAVAQIQPLTASAFNREQPERSTQQKPFWINRDDCEADDVLTFEMKVTAPTDYNFEVWVGDADCTTKAQRIGDDAECWQVYKEPHSTQSFYIDIRVQDVIAKRPESGVRAVGDQDVCDDNWASSLTFYFMYVDDTDDVVGNNIRWSETGVDIKGPLPPSNVSAGVGEESLVAKWDSSTSLESLSYNIYCAPRADVPANGAVTDGGSTNVAADAAVTPAPQSDAAADSGASDAAVSGNGVDAAAAPVPSASVSSASGPSTAADAAVSGGCSAPGLIEGQVPGADLTLCGEVATSNATRGFAEGLQNGTEYAIAVAAVDQLGNPGELSNVACNVPAPVTDYYEHYRAVGGEGGGGFCAVGAIGQTKQGPSATLAALAALGIGLAFSYRRQNAKLS